MTILTNGAGAVLVCFPDEQSLPVGDGPIVLTAFDSGCLLYRGDALLGMAASEAIPELLVASEVYLGFPRQDGIHFAGSNVGRIRFDASGGSAGYP